VAGAVGLHEQGCLAAGGEAEVADRLDSRDRRAVEELQQRRPVSVGSEGEHPAHGVVEGVEGGQRGQGRVRGGDQPDPRGGDDAERAFGAHKESGEVVAHDTLSPSACRS
jgi:hypothetical protein